jgi:hypothetical protein
MPDISLNMGPMFSKVYGMEIHVSMILDRIFINSGKIEHASL